MNHENKTRSPLRVMTSIVPYCSVVLAALAGALGYGYVSEGEFVFPTSAFGLWYWPVVLVLAMVVVYLVRRSRFRKQERNRQC